MNAVGFDSVIIHKEKGKYSIDKAQQNSYEAFFFSSIVIVFTKILLYFVGHLLPKSSRPFKNVGNLQHSRIRQMWTKNLYSNR